MVRRLPNTVQYVLFGIAVFMVGVLIGWVSTLFEPQPQPRQQPVVVEYDGAMDL